MYLQVNRPNLGNELGILISDSQMSPTTNRHRLRYKNGMEALEEKDLVSITNRIVLGFRPDTVFTPGMLIGNMFWIRRIFEWSEC